jgi:hypothetical protein
LITVLLGLILSLRLPIVEALAELSIVEFNEIKYYFKDDEPITELEYGWRK